MIELALCAVLGFLAGRLAWMAVGDWFASPLLTRANYRNRHIPTATGLVLPVAVVVIEAGRAVGGSSDLARLLTLLAVTGFCLLGFVDDVVGTGDQRGFRGHLRALAGGQVTTGMLKLLAGAAVAVVVVSPVAGDDPGRVLADAALVALAANLGNLLDRAPGRTTKVGVLVFVVLVAASGADTNLAGVAVVVGAAAALLSADLREYLMLGDAGANLLGAALGLGVVLTAAPATRTAVLIGVAVLNALGEVVSFSRLIESVPPLRAFDRLGRASRSAPPAGGARRRRVRPPDRPAPHQGL